MILTEAEARTKWCPFARVLVSKDLTATGLPLVAAAVNRFGDEETKLEMAVGLCLGSKCMLWAWGDLEWEISHEDKALAPASEGWVRAPVQTLLANWRRQRPDRKGFCSLGSEG